MDFSRFLSVASKRPDVNFLAWLVGFIEGEGSFTVTSRGDLHFVITQGALNVGILYLIKWTLGFGSVVKQGPTTFRYIVQDKEGLELIILLCYRNMHIQKKIDQLITFINAYNVRYGTSLPSTPFVPVRATWNDAWLSGLIDGEGCFSISWIPKRSKFKVVFGIAQAYSKDLLNYFISMFGCGRIEGDVQFIFHGYNGIPLAESHLIPYLSRFPLRTSKLNSFSFWLTLVAYMQRPFVPGDSRHSYIMSSLPYVNPKLRDFVDKVEEKAD